MGIDRLIAVKFPTKYRYYQEEPRNYVIAQLSFPLLYSIVFLVYGFLVRDTDVKKSILVTVGFVLLGWVTTTTANTLSYSITDDLFTIQLIQMYAGITVNFAAASNVFVFYAINSEYRSVIKSMFGIRIKGGMIFEPSSTQTVTKVVPRSVSQPNVVFEKTPAAARRMTVV
ncbi:unnamed protein product [Caenorhabditis nigoni]